MQFHHRLMTAMTISGVSNSEMTQRTGLSASNVSHFTSGQRAPTLQSLQKILEALPNIDARWLVTGKRK